MRGPGYRQVGDTRRTWRCRKCGRERKRLGDVTSLLCECQEGAWMEIVSERILAPRPVQRPSDIERRPSDFGIEPPPPAPPKPAATIIKSALASELDFEREPEKDSPDETVSSTAEQIPPDEDDLNFDNP